MSERGSCHLILVQKKMHVHTNSLEQSCVMGPLQGRQGFHTGCISVELLGPWWAKLKAREELGLYSSAHCR
jgi:hypothetical protein